MWGTATDSVQGTPDAAYKLFADAAERELESATGAAIVRHGARGGRPRLIWKAILKLVPDAEIHFLLHERRLHYPWMLYAYQDMAAAARR